MSTNWGFGSLTHKFEMCSARRIVHLLFGLCARLCIWFECESWQVELHTDKNRKQKVKKDDFVKGRAAMDKRSWAYIHKHNFPSDRVCKISDPGR